MSGRWLLFTPHGGIIITRPGGGYCLLLMVALLSHVREVAIVYSSWWHYYNMSGRWLLFTPHGGIIITRPGGGYCLLLMVALL